MYSHTQHKQFPGRHNLIIGDSVHAVPAYARANQNERFDMFYIDGGHEVCMYVCMYVCMSARTYVCMYVCMHACMYVCIYVCMHTDMPAAARVQISAKYSFLKAALQALDTALSRHKHLSVCEVTMRICVLRMQVCTSMYARTQAKVPYLNL
jgi:hypothetical protein